MLLYIIDCSYSAKISLSLKNKKIQDNKELFSHSSYEV